MSITFLSGPNGNRLFAILPYNAYLELAAAASKAMDGNTEPESGGRYIVLPHSGGERLDLAKFVSYWHRYGTIAMAIGARTQSYAKFKREELNALDPVLRRVFLPEDSPYRNTMQASRQVVDDIVASGLFERCTLNLPEYYRPVQALKIDIPKSLAYLESLGNPVYNFRPGDKVLP